MFGEPYYVRVLFSLQDDWFTKPTPSPDHFARALFDLTRPDQSTYQVMNEIEEINSAAAHMLANEKPELRSGYLLRFRSGDLPLSGVTVSDSVLGQTGIILIDHRHRDLIGNRKQLTKLMDQVIARLHEGQDRIRRFKKVQLEHALSNFISLQPCERPTHTACRCEFALNRRHDLPNIL